ncbi:MAG: circadian clock protein KaiC [Thermoplasmata archaeon]|nr:circadian clock protein KaiC [Thermoplasmata archaeon]
MDNGRIKTYIKGFDEHLAGGIPKGSLVLICGPPGTMKTTMAYNILFNSAKEDDVRGTFFSLEQGRESLLSQMAGLGMDLKEVGDKLSIVDFGLIRRNLERMESKNWLDIFKMYAENLKKNTEYDILVIDSLPVLEVLSSFKNPREDLFYFFEWLRELDVTCIIICEMPANSDNYGEYGEDYISDGIIHTKMERMNDENIQRRIRCVKMRGTDHSTDFFTLLVDGGCLQVTRVLSK